MEFPQTLLKEEVSQDLTKRVAFHKARFRRLFFNRFREMLPSLINYKDKFEGSSLQKVSIDFLKLENALRNNYNVVVGLNNNNVISILGYTRSTFSSENPSELLANKPLTKADINFILPDSLIPDVMREISHYDNCETGNFIVVKNKLMNYVSDMEILEHYTDELSEIVLSRYSISMQAKINTFFMGEVNDETVNELANALYNGAPVVKMNKLFDPKDNIYTTENSHLATVFSELKMEYQNKISELNNMIGINSLAVEKESGVSDTEAKSNRGYTTSNANLYLFSRNNSFSKLNKRFSLGLYAYYDDEVESEIMELQKKEVENDIEKNNNNNGLPSK